MPSNQEYKGKGTKGRNYDELSGVGTSSAGITGTTGNLNDGGRDGGVGTPDLADAGNLQSAGGQPGGTPALGNSRRGPGQQQSGNQQSGNQQSGNLQSGSQQSDNQQSGNQQSGNLQGGSRQDVPPLDQDDVGSDGSLQR